jgi:hypothetical protein
MTKEQRIVLGLRYAGGLRPRTVTAWWCWLWYWSPIALWCQRGRAE